MASDMLHRKYVIPPGLAVSVSRFGAHYKAAKGEPVLIEGPTGVGKTLFIDIFKILYREEEKHKDTPIVTINCSHFKGDLARGELFGYKKGSFTGATQNYPGLIHDADKGLLIMEEIGDLSKDTQAMLLTFIETGEYYGVGERERHKANVQILGATNRPEKLRKDFRYRFFRFSIPPLYERRGDVLYHLDAKSPGLVQRLTPMDALALIAYNWPGNVREIDTLGKILDRQKYIRDERNELRTLTRSRSLNGMPEGRIPVTLDDEIRETMFRIRDLAELLEASKIEITESTDSNLKDRYTKQPHNNKRRSYRTNLGHIVNTILHYFFLGPISGDVSIGKSTIDDVVKKRLTSQLMFYIAKSKLSPWPFDIHNNTTLNTFDLSFQDKLSVQVKEGVRNLYSTTTSINITKCISSLFEEMRVGLLVYCALFFQYHKDNKNLTDMTAGSLLPRHMLDSMSYWKSTYAGNNLQENRILKRIRNSARRGKGYRLLPNILSDAYAVDMRQCVFQIETKLLEVFSGIKLDEDIHSFHSISDRRKCFLRLMRKHPNNAFLKSLVPESMRDAVAPEEEESDELRIPLIPYEQLIDQVERSYHESLLKKTKGNKMAASKIAGVPYQSIITRLKRLGIKADDFK